MTCNPHPRVLYDLISVHLFIIVNLSVIVLHLLLTRAIPHCK